MEKSDYKLISIRIPEDDYEKLVRMQTNRLRSVSAVIRDLIVTAIYNPTNSAPIELRPLGFLNNPVVSEEIKKVPLEIPVHQEFPVTESASLADHKFERRVRPPAPRDIIIAKRAQAAGRPYDNSLEPFFDTING